MEQSKDYLRQALDNRLARITFELGRIAKQYEHYKALQDEVLKRIVELDTREE